MICTKGDKVRVSRHLTKINVCTEIGYERVSNGPESCDVSEEEDKYDIDDKLTKNEASDKECARIRSSSSTPERVFSLGN